MKLATGAGGNWKQSDNYIKETLPTGKQIIRFEPVPAWQTPEAIEELVKTFRIELEQRKIHELILIAAFVLDFLCIHTKEQYYETLNLSDAGWHEEEHNLIPWLEYFLTVVLAAYQRLEELVGVINKPSRG